MRRLLALISVTALMVALMVMPASAQQNQSGLVNVGVQGTNIAIPVSVQVAAALCPNVNVAVLADLAGTQEVACEVEDVQTIQEVRQDLETGGAKKGGKGQQ